MEKPAAYLDIRGFAKKVSGKSVKHVHWFLGKISPNTPDIAKYKCTANQGVEFSGVHTKVHTRFVSSTTEQCGEQWAEYHHMTDVNLVHERSE